MKRIALFALLAIQTGCGNPPENYRGRAPIALSRLAADSVSTLDQLPSCSEATVNELIFVKDKDSFKICRDQSWRDVASEETVIGDLRVAEIAKIESSDFDLCPDAKEEFCYFAGGEYIRYSDGSIQYSARVARKKSTMGRSDDMRRETSDLISSVMNQPASSDSSSMKILDAIPFKGVPSSIWLVHDSRSKTFHVTLDSNQNEEIERDDQVLFPLELKAY